MQESLAVYSLKLCQGNFFLLGVGSGRWGERCESVILRQCAEMGEVVKLGVLVEKVLNSGVTACAGLGRKSSGSGGRRLIRGLLSRGPR